MYTQIMGTIMHVGWNFLFVYKMELGIMGTGLASSVTSFIIFIGNYVVTHFTKELDKATAVKIYDKHVYRWRDFKI